MGLTRLVDGAPRSDQRLREHLPTEHATGPDVSVAAAVDVDLERFEIEEIEEIGEGDGHLRGGWRLAAGGCQRRTTGERRRCGFLRITAGLAAAMYLTGCPYSPPPLSRVAGRPPHAA